jgi:hypothetical protein
MTTVHRIVSRSIFLYLKAYFIFKHNIMVELETRHQQQNKVLILQLNIQVGFPTIEISYRHRTYINIVSQIETIALYCTETDGFRTNLLV